MVCLLHVHMTLSIADVMERVLQRVKVRKVLPKSGNVCHGPLGPYELQHDSQPVCHRPLPSCPETRRHSPVCHLSRFPAQGKPTRTWSCSYSIQSKSIHYDVCLAHHPLDLSKRDVGVNAPAWLKQSPRHCKHSGPGLPQSVEKSLHWNRLGLICLP